MASTKPYLVTYSLADDVGNLNDPPVTTTVYARSQREAKQIVQRKTEYKGVVSRVRNGGV